MIEAIISHSVLVGQSITHILAWRWRTSWGGWRQCGGDNQSLGKGGGLVEKRRIEEGEGCFGGIEGISVDGQRGSGDGGEQGDDVGPGGTRSRGAIEWMRWMR